jgi:heme-degrading monooxygenase HmoA
MLCALTVRKLKPGKADEFLEKFGPPEEAPAGFRRFYALRSTSDENEVITFGLFDGTLEELRAGQSEGGYEERRQAIEELVESVGTDGIYEVVEERALD